SPRGDVASVAGPQACVADDEAFLIRATALALDPDVRRAEGENARARYDGAIDRARAVERLASYCRELIGV
ncbi:MAG TPA: hypothetical protein PKZ99_06505, partial [Azospirillaceae bacterium]|nr:hypothetical protein [Azospirillaceae bacterium]